MNQNILSRVRRWYLINIQSVVEDLFRKVYQFWKDWQTLRRIRIIWAFYKLDENVKSLRKTETAWNPREPFSDPTGSFGLLFTLSFVTVLPIVHCISICLWIVCSCLWIVWLPVVAGGDKWAKKHEKWHRPALYVQLLAQTEKPQWVTPQTTKYRYRTVI